MEEQEEKRRRGANRNNQNTLLTKHSNKTKQPLFVVCVWGGGYSHVFGVALFATQRKEKGMVKLTVEQCQRR